MASAERTWIRDLVVVPLLVGIVITAFAFALTRIIRDQKKLTYTIDGPTRYFSALPVECAIHAKNAIHTVLIEDVTVYKVHIRNSGSDPLENIPVKLISSDSIKVLKIGHETTPRHGVRVDTADRIEKDSNGNFSQLFTYELLNQGDGDVITLLTNGGRELQLSARAAALKVEREELRPRGALFRRFGALALGVASLIAGLSTALIERLWVRRAGQ